jgi:hypothetical protein
MDSAKRRASRFIRAIGRMSQSTLFQVFANAVLVAHVAFIMFVVVGLLVIFIGGGLKWFWVRNLWFRLAHLAAIAFVVIESWVGIVCPLTSLAFWFRRLFFFDEPAWVFTMSYSIFGALVLLSWLLFPPRCSFRERNLSTLSMIPPNRCDKPVQPVNSDFGRLDP